MLAIIPARKGSKGLKKKNIHKIYNKPLIAFTIEEALKTKKIDEIIVSTDCEEIAEIAKKYGATVPFLRPKRLAKDSSDSIDVYKYTIKELEKKNKKIYNNFISLLPTCPLRNYKDINNAINIFFKKKADSVISVTEAAYPIEWNLSISNNGNLKKIFKHSNNTKNRQKFKTLYIPNGGIYIFSKAKIFNNKEFYFKKTYSYIMPKERSIDIDDKFDLDLAKIIIKRNIDKKN